MGLVASLPDWPSTPSRALLAAGTASYEWSDFGNLSMVPTSLRAIVGTLTDLGFASVAGSPGYSIDPTPGELRSAVRQAAATAPVVVFYYTGHGVHPERDSYYLVNRKSQPTDMTGTALSTTDLPKLLTLRDENGELVADQPTVLVILDCCYSSSAGMEMLGDTLRGIGNPNMWVIASVSALEYAQQGRFAAAFCDAIRRPTTGPSTQFLSLESIVQAVNDAQASHTGQKARVFPPATGSPGIPPFFPNKNYWPGLAGLTVSEQHWLSRVRGAPQESTTGFYLTGRTGRIQAAEDLARWMTEPDHRGLAVVTGSPGTGKSALLALPVLLTQPSRREDLLSATEPGSLIQRTADLLPVDTPIVAVHARGLNTDQAAGAIAQALGRTYGTASTLLEDLDAVPETQQYVVVVDAVDESFSPDTLFTSLLLPLSRQPRLQVAVGARRHVLSAIHDADLIIDLDTPGYQDPQALTVYIRRLLLASEEPGVVTPYQGADDEASSAVAAVIAQRAISGDQKTESFLIGRFLALSVRGRTEPVDITNPGWQSELPTELTEAFDEDLARLGARTSLARTLLAALAWARGPGLPWENIWTSVARALAGAGGHEQGSITNDDVRWLLEKAGAYLVEDRGPGQRSVYRPFHDVLAAHLRGEQNTEPDSHDPAVAAAWQRRHAQTERVITEALLATVPADESGRNWASAHPYLRTYLAQHAAAAGTETFAALMQDAGFLAVADQVTLSPYRGLSAFEERDAAFFFGRETAATHVLERMAQCLKQPGLAVVSGTSGAGKSSLLRAGVLPRIRKAGLPSDPGAANWPCVLFTPTRAPLDELAVRVAALSGADADSLLRELQADPASLAAAAQQAASLHSGHSAADASGPMPGQPPRMLLIVDQFEQLFTQCPDEEQRQAFITALHAAATGGSGTNQTPAALVVLGVRADFEARCADYPQLADAVQDRYLVTSMTDRQLRMAITEPAGKAGASVDDDLVTVLLAEMRSRHGVSRAGVLPMLSHALDQAWRSRVGEVLTLADYERTGGIQGAVAGSAQRAYERLTATQRAAARQIFLRLTTTSDDGVNTADRVARAELMEGREPAEVHDVKAVLEAFAAEGLLTLAADTVEISHEVLLTAWPLLRDTWLAETYADRAIRARLLDVASEWESHRRDPAYLYSGSLLEVTLAAIERTEGDPARLAPLTRAEQAFLGASRYARRRRARRLQAVVALLTTLVVATGAVAVVAFQARQQAIVLRNNAIVDGLASQSEALGATSPTLAKLLSVAAWRLKASDNSYYAMLAAAALPAIAVGAIGTGPVSAVAFSPDGKLLASTDIDGTVRLWNVTAHQQVSGPFAGRAGPVSAVAFSPDGRVLASADAGGTVRLWDITDPAHPTVISRLSAGHPRAVDAVAFSPDGRLLASADIDGTVQLWDVTHPTDIMPIGGLPAAEGGRVNAVAFSPDGKTLAIAGADGTVRLWNVAAPADVTVKGRLSAGGTGPVNAVAFSHDGKTLASADAHGTVRLWNVTTGRQFGNPLTGHAGSVNAVAFSHDGKTLATVSVNGIVQLWYVPTGGQIGQPLNDRTGSVTAVTFSPDGRTLAGSGATLRLWAVAFLENPVPSLCASAGRSLTPAEWAHYAPGFPYQKVCP